MTGSSVLEPYIDALTMPAGPGVLRIGVAVPRRGVLGLMAPAAMASAILACEQVRDSYGVDARLVPVDASDAITAAREIEGAVSMAGVAGMCGLHSSDVLAAADRVVGGRVDYVFAPPHEGWSGQRAVLLGPSPEDQLAPVLRWATTHRRCRRWCLIGNDYVWPRAVHAIARTELRRLGAVIVHESLARLGDPDVERLVDAVRSSGADAVVVSLVGRDLVRFNRAFTEAGLSRVIRFSGALDETGLLEAGGNDRGELYASMPWYCAQADADPFAQEFQARWGSGAPMPTAYAQGLHGAVWQLAAKLVGDSRRPPDGGSPRRCELARAEGLSLLPGRGAPGD